MQREKSLIGTWEILTNRCASADDLLQGLIEFIPLLFTCPLSLFPLLVLHLSLSPRTSNIQLSLSLFFFFFFHRRRLFFLARSFIHPDVAKLYTVKLETANGARFPLHAVAILPPLLPSHTTLHFPLRVAAFYFHFSRGNGKVCHDRKVGWE